MTHQLTVPALGESISEATVAKWLKKPGDQIQLDEMIVELETDKVTLEVNAPVAGFMDSITMPEGSIVSVGQILGLISETQAAGLQSPTHSSNESLQPAKPQTETPSTSETSSPKAMPSSEPILSPAAQKMADENKVNPESLVGTGKAGRITQDDVTQFVNNQKNSSSQKENQDLQNASSTSLNSAVIHSTSQHLQVTQPIERVRMTRLRQRIAERLKEAQNTAAMLTTFNEIDMTQVMATRESYRDKFEKRFNIKLGFMSFFVKAAVSALKEIPAVNSEIDGDFIVYKNHYDIGVAVSAPQGLVVPVVRDADHLNFAEIEMAISQLGDKAKSGKLSMQDLSGGTFTITNGGVFGSLMSTPILNPPQSGILGMHKIQQRPMAINGKVEIRPMMYIALTYDHRIIDGREAVTFLVRIKENIEDPQRILLGI